MIRIAEGDHAGRPGWPRTSGDDPIAGSDVGQSVALAPHERG